MARALLIVDVQNDFTEGGALGTEGGAQVARDITTHLREHAGEYSVVLASRDWHDADNDNGGHFAAEPDYVDTWPRHCIAGTPGADFHPDLDTSFIDVEVRKGQGAPHYSAFQGVTDAGQNLIDVLASRDVEDLDIVGIATDHCVRASALDALEAGVQVRVLDGLTSAVGKESRAAALAEIRAAGGEVVDR
ncbi:isochorismatase family protein [Gulosibacter molinativorax]|uniref:nicotinamidase n=1 Tax=Gulosibacter molinativorax TaxID=256821 RepID=A0ABT7CB59_9MICO|nr:isochorismatase family protein [Gulosibacter molinativorax]MDJ1372360.1 nicotinamidase [Gulosibacter molinativorax]